jgi:hypothetical protein
VISLKVAILFEATSSEEVHAVFEGSLECVKQLIANISLHADPSKHVISFQYPFPPAVGKIKISSDDLLKTISFGILCFVQFIFN